MIAVKTDNPEEKGLYFNEKTGELITIGYVCPVCKAVIEQGGALIPHCKNMECPAFFLDNQIVKQVITIIPK